MGNRERMKQALAGHMAKPAAAKVTVNTPAAAAKKVNPRSAAARDARAKARGRLPENTFIATFFANGFWNADMRFGFTGDMTEHVGQREAMIHMERCKKLTHKADGLFRCLEELDIMFWEWFAAPGDEDVKKRLVFDTTDHKPEPMPEELKRA